MMAAKLLRQSVVLRELMPQDLKLELDQLSRDEAVNSARYLAEVVGKAHARQMDAATRKAFNASFKIRDLRNSTHPHGFGRAWLN